MQLLPGQVGRGCHRCSLRDRGGDEDLEQSRALPSPRSSSLPHLAPGYPRQDLLDARDQPLVLRGVALDGSVKPRHVKVQRPERRRLPGACGSAG